VPAALRRAETLTLQLGTPTFEGLGQIAEPSLLAERVDERIFRTLDVLLERRAGGIERAQGRLAACSSRARPVPRQSGVPSRLPVPLAGLRLPPNARRGAQHLHRPRRPLFELGTSDAGRVGTRGHLGRAETDFGQLAVDAPEAGVGLLTRTAFVVGRCLATLDGLDECLLVRVQRRSTMLPTCDLGAPRPLRSAMTQKSRIRRSSFRRWYSSARFACRCNDAICRSSSAHHVLHAEEVVARALHLSLGRDLPGAEPCRASRLLDEVAKLVRLRVHELLDPPLLDDRVGLRADTRPEKELRDVLQPARRLIDEVLGVSRPEITATHQDLAGLCQLGREPVGRAVTTRRSRP
jgi:hypothetical protein